MEEIDGSWTLRQSEIRKAARPHTEGSGPEIQAHEPTAMQAELFTARIQTKEMIPHHAQALSLLVDDFSA